MSDRKATYGLINGKKGPFEYEFLASKVARNSVEMTISTPNDAKTYALNNTNTRQDVNLSKGDSHVKGTLDLFVDNSQKACEYVTFTGALTQVNVAQVKLDDCLVVSWN